MRFPIGSILTLPAIGVARLRGFLEQGSPDRLKAELRTVSLGVAAGAVSRCAFSHSLDNHSLDFGFFAQGAKAVNVNASIPVAVSRAWVLL
jgi:hypothetical protein